jgi:hypothetical protein
MLLKDLQSIGFSRITIIFCQFAHLYNVNKFYGFSRYIKRTNHNYYMGALSLLYRGCPDGQPHGMPSRQDRRLRCPSPWGKTLGALGEELGAPTKAGAAPPRRGLPDEGGGTSGPPLVRWELPLAG